MQYYSKQDTHWPSLLFGVIVLIVVIVLFATLALGAYFVYNGEISNVVASTYGSNTSQPILSISAVGLSTNVQRTVWVDPQITENSDGTLSVSPGTGFIVANATTDSSGNLNQNFTLSKSLLDQISTDGQSVHTVWIVGLNGTNGTNPIPLSIDSEQNYSVATPVNGITLFVTLFTFVLPFQSNLGTLFIILWTTFVLLFAMAVNGPFRNIIGSLKQTSKQGLQGVFSNSALAMAAIFTIVLWVSIILAYLQQSVGVSTGSLPPADPLLEFVELSIAPIREELGFRVIPIGVAAFLIILSKRRVRDSVLALWNPSKYLKKVDSPDEYKHHLNIIYVMIAISSILFGVAHYVLGSGWGPGKITEAAVAGVALAALYYKFGLPSAILLHWAIDYALTALSLAPWLVIGYGLFILYTGAVALLSSAALVILFVRRIQSRRTGQAISSTGSYAIGG